MEGSGSLYRVIKGSREEVLNKLFTLFRSTAQFAVSRSGAFKSALAGGKTPAPLYKMISEGFELWKESLFFPTDERFVPMDHPNSNYRMIRENLGERAKVRRINTDLTPQFACKDFENFLTEVGEIDMTILGLGEDGHTASLFPGTECSPCGRYACVSTSPDGLDRISMTLNAINNSRVIAFLVLGKEKEDALRRLVRRDPAIPSSRVQGKERTFIFTDLLL